MLKADRDFNQAMADRDMSRFLSFVAEDATFNASRGRDAVGKAWAPFFSPDGPRLSLGADEGRVARRRRCRLHGRHVGAPDAKARTAPSKSRTASI